MTFEDSIPVFLPEFYNALWLFGTIFVVLGLLGFACYFVIGSLRYGPGVAGDSLYKLLIHTTTDLWQTSPRRTFALARLAFREALRNRVLIVFGIFAVILLFAGWFLDANNFNPGHLYLNFVLTATTWLVMLLALLLSCLSLPSDIKSRTIYTVITKPVRATEIVLGRIIGFSAVGTILIAAMGMCSYIFVTRALDHRHTIDPADLHAVNGSAGSGVTSAALREGQTSEDHGHRHFVTLDENGNGWTNVRNGHRHKVTNYKVSEPLDELTAIVPIYGSLKFLDRAGHTNGGISVGKEWGYRRYIEGGTLAAAIWTFDDVTEKQFPEGLFLDISKLSVFRLRKGDIEQTALGSIALRNPVTGVMSRPVTFSSKEYSIDHHFIPRTLERKTAKKQVGQPRHNSEKLDLFKDLVSDGKVEVWLQCDEPAQYFGVAQADVYLLADQASFRLNFCKGYVGVWLQMVLVTAMGVMWSTLLSTPVALLATAGSGLLGFFAKFVSDMHLSESADDLHKKVWGGGPIESLVRLVTQNNLVSKIEHQDTFHVIDEKLLFVLKSLVSLVPDFHKFSDAEYVSSGFNIPGNLLGLHFVYAFGYLLLAFILGYLFLRTREIAA